MIGFEVVLIQILTAKFRPHKKPKRCKPLAGLVKFYLILRTIFLQSLTNIQTPIILFKMEMELSIDPAVFFPVEISEQIFLHLKVKDLMNCTLVSPTWNEIIESSRLCMGKVCLCFKGPVYRLKFGFLLPSFKVLKKSTRRYQNVLISVDRKHVKEFLIPALEYIASKRQWKCVQISNIKFLTSSSFLTLMESIKDTVEVLDICYVDFDDRDEVIRKFQFQKLKVLKLGEKAHELFPMFSDCSTLQKFSICPSVQVENLNGLKAFFHQQKNLTDLDLRSFVSDAIYSVFPISTQLKKFSFNFNSFGSSFNRSNILKFLATQENLEEIHIGELHDLEILNFVMTRKTVKSLIIGHLASTNHEESSLATSNSIESLKFPLTNFLAQAFSAKIKNEKIKVPEGIEKITKKILKAVPNLENLAVTYVDESLAKFMNESLKKLRKVETLIVVDEEVCEKIWPGIQKVKRCNW